MMNINTDNNNRKKHTPQRNNETVAKQSVMKHSHLKLSNERAYILNNTTSAGSDQTSRVMELN